MLIRRDDKQILGAITLDNIRRGPSQSGTAGYWIGAAHARQREHQLHVVQRDAHRDRHGADAARLWLDAWRRLARPRAARRVAAAGGALGTSSVPEEQQQQRGAAAEGW